MKIDLNCDMGESYGRYVLGCDEEAIEYVTSINVACGFHASDPGNMAQTVKLAKKYGVAIGAHPSYPDLVGFGRRPMAVTPEEVRNDVIYQIGALSGFCQAEGIRLQHVKAHGALYNTAAKELPIALALAEAIKAVDPKLSMLCLANSAMVEAARQVGVKYVEEGFADRAYLPDGKLMPRSKAGSVLKDVEVIAERVLQMVQQGSVQTAEGGLIALKVQTICVHGDSPGAVNMLKRIKEKLTEARVTLVPFGEDI